MHIRRLVLYAGISFTLREYHYIDTPKRARARGRFPIVSSVPRVFAFFPPPRRDAGRARWFDLISIAHSRGEPDAPTRQPSSASGGTAVRTTATWRGSDALTGPCRYTAAGRTGRTWYTRIVSLSLSPQRAPFAAACEICATRAPPLVARPVSLARRRGTRSFNYPRALAIRSRGGICY